MDAGVPVKSPIAGIAMGMLLGDRESVLKDADVMDFKVAEVQGADARDHGQGVGAGTGGGGCTSLGRWRRRWRGRRPS